MSVNLNWTGGATQTVKLEIWLEWHEEDFTELQFKKIQK